MNRSYFFPKNIGVKNVREYPVIHREGNERKDEAPDVIFFGDRPEYVTKVVRDAEGHELQRYKGLESGTRTGLDTDDIMFKGNRAEVEAEEYDEDTESVYQYLRVYDQTGRPQGTYRTKWQRSGERQMIHTETKRIFT